MPSSSGGTTILLEEFGKLTKAYAVDMRPMSEFGPYKIIFLGSAAYGRQENKKFIKSTRLDLRSWDKSLPETEREAIKELEREEVEGKKRVRFAAAKGNEIGLSIDDIKLKMKDINIEEVEAEHIPLDRFGDVQEAFHDNCLALVEQGGPFNMGGGDRRLFAVVRGSYYAVVSANIKKEKETKVELVIPVSEGEGVTLVAGDSIENSFKRKGEHKSVIGAEIACFCMSRLHESPQEKIWKVSGPIHIVGAGRKPRDLKDLMVWTSSACLGRKFFMLWYSERFSYIIGSIDKVLESDLVDSDTKTVFEDCMLLEKDTGETVLMDESLDRAEFATDLRLRGGGPEEAIDSDGFVMGFDLRSLERRVIGLTLLPVAFEALGDEEFDQFIEWNTVSKSISEDGSETVEVKPTKVSMEAAVNAERSLLEFCIKSLQRKKTPYVTAASRNLTPGAAGVPSVQRSHGFSHYDDYSHPSLVEPVRSAHGAVSVKDIESSQDLNDTGDSDKEERSNQKMG